MAALPNPTTGANAFARAFLLAGLALAVVLSTILVAGLQVRTNSHATDRHGPEARQSRQALRDAGPQHRWDCPDGRTRVVRRTGDGWAVMVLEGDAEITSFITRCQGYVLKMLEGCTNPWRYAHP